MSDPQATPSVSPTTNPAPRSLAAERMRRHRQRKRNSMRCLTIELRETEIDALIRKELLKPRPERDYRRPLCLSRSHIGRNVVTRNMRPER